MKMQQVFRWLSAIGTYDFCPWANRYVLWLRQPIGWFAVAALAAGLIGAFVAPQGWVVCGVVLVVMALGMVWPWLAIGGLEARIEFDRRRCYELAPVTVVLTVTNRRPWPVWGLLVERGFFRPVGPAQERAATALSRVAGWSTSRFDFAFNPPRRGAFPHEPPVLATGFPFGLWVATQTMAVAEPLVAWPRTTNLRSLPLLRGDRLAPTGNCIDRAGHDGEILAARPYIRGDSLRRVHWVHTARRDTLIVCERQTASRRSVLIVLDPGSFSSNTGADEKAWDWGLRVIASLCREFHTHHCDLMCELNGERFLVPSGAAGLRRLLDRLAVFQPDAQAGTVECLGPTSVMDRLTILVTSAERWQWLVKRGNGTGRCSQVRAVVLDQGRPDSAGMRERYHDPIPGTKRPWIGLALADEPSRQLQRQWERQCHEDWAK